MTTFQTSLSAVCLFTLLSFGAHAIEPSGHKQPGALEVQVTGRGKAMILIPGLSCSGDVWEQTVSRYQDNYQCHVISLPGFAGLPPIQVDNYLETVRDRLSAYIKTHRLEKPVVVGHSLGGFLALWLAANDPELVGSLVIVDGLPFLPAAHNPNITLTEAKKIAGMMRSAMGSQTKEQVRATAPMYLGTMISDENQIKVATEWSVRSDQKTVAQAMSELYSIDLRDEVSRIEAPTLVMGAWIGFKAYGATRANSLERYNAQFAAMKNARVWMTDTAKHFIMWDDPDGYFSQFDAFLTNNEVFSR